MEVIYDGLKEKSEEKESKELARRRLYDKIMSANAEIDVCPVCGSNEHISRIRDKQFGVVPVIVEYTLEGECKSCGSRFKTDVMFSAYHWSHNSLERYDKNTGLFSMDKAIKEEQKSQVLWFLGSITFVIIGIIFNVFLRTLLSKWVELGGIIGIDVIIFGLSFICGFFGVISESNIKELKVFVECVNRYMSQLKSKDVPVFVEGQSKDDDAIIDFLEDCKTWEFKDYWECDD